MIELKVQSNTFAYLPEYGRSDWGFSHQETSKYIFTFDYEVFRHGKNGAMLR
jgi:phage pi2 protein 07